jgi:hypothetical protein
MTEVQPLLPYAVNRGRLTLAGGARAGDWIFASGLMPTRFGSAARPLSGEPDWTIQEGFNQVVIGVHPDFH